MTNKKPRTPEEKQIRYFLFCRLHNEGTPAEDIAERLLGRDSSPTMLYRELGKEGFPVCQICGAYSANETFCDKHLREIEQKRKQGATDLSGEAIKLPPAIEAEELFREAIAELSRLVDPPEVPPGDQGGWQKFKAAYEAQFTLFFLEEYLQGEHIVSYSVEDRANAPVFYRKDYTAETWQEMCDECGVSSSADHIILEDISAIPYGAKKAPAEILVKLIGVYVLADKPLEPLVEILNHAPGTVNWTKLDNLIHGYSTESRKHIPGMLDMLRSIATEVRGGIRRTGRFEKLSDNEVEIVWKIARTEGDISERNELYEKLQEKGYSRRHLDQLSKLQPKRPDWELLD